VKHARGRRPLTTHPNDPPPDTSSQEEQDALLTFLLALRLDRARDFLGRQGLPKYGNRADLRGRLEDNLAARTLAIVDIVDFLDEVEPWAKQHVILYDGGDRLVEGWQDSEALRVRLGEANVAQLLDGRLPLGLPEELTLSSIRVEHNRVVTIAAVERRRYREHDQSLDREEVDAMGRRVDFLAYVHVITRGLLIFRWDLLTNTASLHMTQGERGYDYGGAERRFAELVRPFLDLARFQHTDLRRLIGKLHELERAGTPEARSHRLAYRSRGGRNIEAASPTFRDSVIGEARIDDALTAIAGESTGRLGNFYWLAGVSPVAHHNPLPGDLHVIVMANDSRVNFMAPSSQEVVTYVLQRIRALS
jgi:hypothetical protein